MSDAYDMYQNLPESSNSRGNPVYELIESIAKMCAHRTRARKARVISVKTYDKVASGDDGSSEIHQGC